MKIRILFVCVSLCLATVLLSACGTPALPGGATPTITRTPRPTFTPAPEFTNTPTRAPATDTPAASATPNETATSASTATATRPAVTVRPANTQPPPPPTIPPFPVSPDPGLSPSGTFNFPCDQAGSFYEIILYTKIPGSPPRPFKAGLSFAVLDTAGNLLRDGAGKPLVGITDDGAMSGQAYGANCMRESSITNPDRFNGKLDVGDVVRASTTDVTMIFRFVKSASDLSPQSANVTITFPKSSARRWWMYFQAR